MAGARSGRVRPGRARVSKDKKPNPPVVDGGGQPACGAVGTCPCPNDFTVTAPCRILKVNGGAVQMSASELPGFPAGAYAWTTGSAKIRLTNANTSTVTVQGLA